MRFVSMGKVAAIGCIDLRRRLGISGILVSLGVDFLFCAPFVFRDLVVFAMAHQGALISGLFGFIARVRSSLVDLIVYGKEYSGAVGENRTDS